MASDKIETLEDLQKRMRFFVLSEYADEWGCHPQTLYRLVNYGVGGYKWKTKIAKLLGLEVEDIAPFGEGPSQQES